MLIVATFAFLSAIGPLFLLAEDNGSVTAYTLPRQIPEELFIIAKQAIMNQFQTGEQKSFRHVACTDHGRGLFVRLMNGGRERGCIGFVRGVASLEETAAVAAVDAAFFDPRYRPVTEKELDELVMEITVIGPLEPMKNWQDFSPGRHSVYLVTAYNSTFMQGQIAVERNWNRKQFLEALCRKAGIDESSYMRKDTRLYRARTVFRTMHFAEISTGK